jgi:hypothetical protein
MADTSPAHARRRPLLVLVAVAVLVVAGVAVAIALVHNGGATGRTGGKVLGATVSKTGATTRVVPPSSSSSTKTTPSSSAPSKHTKPAAPHDVVAAAAPTAFTYTAPHYRIRAHVCGMEYVRPLDPPGEQHHTVCWVQHDFGFAPASRGKGTTYVLGHSWGQDPLEVLNKISESAMRQVLPEIDHGDRRLISGIGTYPITRLNGDVITLRTATGVLKYTVRDAYAVAKSDAGYIQPLMNQHTRNRVVIITCGELNHVDYDYNIIVSAFLTSSKASGSRT